MIKAVLFDLDATLLPMNQDLFLKTYIGKMAEKMVPHGYVAAEFTEAVWLGSYEMIKNDGSKLNSEAFWSYFCKRFGESARDDEQYINEFYRTEFCTVRSVCGFNEAAKRVVERVRAEGIPTVLATNPVFPEVATVERIRWAGLTPEHFDFITTYDNSRYSKPNPNYYLDIASRIGIAPEDCLMVGNDTGDDMSAALTGMQTYLVTDHLINNSGEDISKYQNGTLSDLEKYLDKIFSA